MKPAPKPKSRVHAQGTAAAPRARQRPVNFSAKIKTPPESKATQNQRLKEKPKKAGGRRYRIKPKPGQANARSKLNDELQKKLCGLIASGLRQEDACQLCGIDRSTLYDWRARGSAEPESRFGQLLAEFEKADTLARAKMVKKLLDDPSWQATWKIMCNKWPEIFRETYQLRQEISGPAGGPVPVEVSSFVVEIKCDQEIDFGPIIDRSNGNGAASSN